MRWLGYLISLLCIAGVVSSIARGAVLSAGLAMAMLWLRARNKLRLIGGTAVAAAVVAIAMSWLHPGGAFVEEMKTISEGNKAGTGQVRWVLWDLGMDVFADSPLIGVGSYQFGPIAAREIAYDSGRAVLQDPSNLYNAALHNIYVQLLAEFGLIGTGAWLLTLWMFFSDLAAVRRRRSRERWVWRKYSFDVRDLTYGLECAMVAFVANGFFYNQLHEHWYWTLVTFARVMRYAEDETTEAPPAAVPSATGEVRLSKLLRQGRAT
jgi:O-antigen ligase